MTSRSVAGLWFRSVVMNGLGEMVGLGLTFAFGAVAISYLGSQDNFRSTLLVYLAAVLSSDIESTVVGLAQWWVMHPWFTVIRLVSWWLATFIGALLAYILGYLPVTTMNLGKQSAHSQAPATEPPKWMILLFAAILGIIAGAVLSFAQWLVLRRKVAGSTIWIPANMLAWLVGMPIIFWGIDRIQKINELPQRVVNLGILLLVTGLIVGAIHRAFLVRMAKAVAV